MNDNYLGFSEEIIEKELVPSRLQIAIESAETELLKEPEIFKSHQNPKKIYFIYPTEGKLIPVLSFKINYSNVLNYYDLLEEICMNVVHKPLTSLTVLADTNYYRLIKFAKPYLISHSNLSFDKIEFRDKKIHCAMLGGESHIYELEFLLDNKLVCKLKWI